MHLQKFRQYKNLVLKSQKQKSEAIFSSSFWRFHFIFPRIGFSENDSEQPASGFRYTTKNANIF
jgi:hypothetical protein